jgi:hypothetical protein
MFGVSLLGVVLAGACAAGEPRLAVAASRAPERATRAGLAPVLARELVVTSGRLEPEPGAAAGAARDADRFLIRSPLLRAWVGQQSRASLELEFVYLGPTGSAAPLGSGELRRQIGLELHAQDSCNLLYVMWRIEPVQRLVVSLKSNPGQHQHSECADRGYLNLEPDRARELGPLRVGERHVLRAAVLEPTPAGAELEVQVDGVSVWRGRLPAAAAALAGPVGLRSDNAQFQVRLRAGSPSQ